MKSDSPDDGTGEFNKSDFTAMAYLKKTSYVILFLYLITLQLSIAGMELFSSLLAIISLFYIRPSSFQKKVDFKQPFIYIILFLITVVISGALSTVKTDSLIDIFGYSRGLVLFFAVYFFMKKHFESFKVKWWPVFLSLAAFVGIYALVQAITGKNYLVGNHELLSPYKNFYRSVGFFESPLSFSYSMGILLMCFLPWSLSQQLYKQSKIKIAIYFSGIIGLVISVFSSGSRGAWLGLFVALLISTLLVNRKKVYIAMLGIITIIFMIVLSSSSLKSRLTSIFDMNIVSNYSRFSIWEGHLRIFADHPILGTGLKQNNELIQDYYKKYNIRLPDLTGPHHAHNDYIQILAGTGVIGFLFFITILIINFKIGYQLWKQLPEEKWKEKYLALGCFLAQLFYCVGAGTQCNFTDAEVNHMLMFSWAILLTIQYKNKDKITT